MRYGFIIPGGDVRTIAELAYEAEAAGWDGVFIPDCICIVNENDPNSVMPGFDPWVTLAAMAMRTERVLLGTMLTPVSRRRPWKLAREVATLDQLSNGRMILPVGLGALEDVGFTRVGEAIDRKVRAQLLDEGLAILAGLLSGRPFSFSGEHYQIQEMTFLPPPVQSPRIPIWVVGAWPRMKSISSPALRSGPGVLISPQRAAIRWEPCSTRCVVRRYAESTLSSTTTSTSLIGRERSMTTRGKLR